MLLRRITKHVKDQNWFAVGIDFVIVVIGVFIGIQVANWNEARTDAIQEQEILADLLTDLQADQASLSVSLELVTLGIDGGNILLREAGLDPIRSVSSPVRSSALNSNILEAKSPPPLTDEIRGDLWKHVMIRLFPRHSNGSIETIIAAGNSSTLKNDVLYQELLRYRTLWIAVEDAQINTFRPLRDRVIFAGQEHGFSPLTPIDADFLAEALGLDPTLKGALRTFVEYTVIERGFYERLQQQSQALETRVTAELNK
ncbi:MAG: hypothetical protein AAFN91_10960 [Pseudomonadota bacterium]